MAISTNFAQIQQKYNSRHWKSVDEFEEFWLKEISETRADTNYYTDRNGIEQTIKPINHHPVLKEYEVWMEGYAATGESSDATLLGKTLARNFAQACDIIMCKDHLKWINKVNQPDYKEYCPPSTWSYDPHKLSVWACKLYWSEELARKSFG